MKRFLTTCFLLASTAAFADETAWRYSSDVRDEWEALMAERESQETPEEAVEGEAYDPLEPMNRVIFEFNDIMDGLFFEPMAKIYKGVFPDFLRQRVTYFIQNFRSPVNLGNNLLQGDMGEAGNTLGRFAINTTLGVAGLFEVAEDWGMPYDREDFGQTLGTWGVGEGFYLVLPLLGPCSARDTVGRVGDWSLQPLNWWAYTTEGHDVYPLVLTGMDALDARTENLDVIADLRKNSLDYYASTRAWYTERRRALILGEALAKESDSPSLADDSDD